MSRDRKAGSSKPETWEDVADLATDAEIDAEVMLAITEAYIGSSTLGGITLGDNEVIVMRRMAWRARQSATAFREAFHEIHDRQLAADKASARRKDSEGSAA